MQINKGLTIFAKRPYRRLPTRSWAQPFAKQRISSFQEEPPPLPNYAGFEDLRDWGRSCKMEVSGRLEEYALQFANRIEAAGAIVHFAHDAAEAADIATGIAVKRGARTAVKSKSMTAEEISLNEALLQAGVTVTETDLGEYIIQLAGEKPSHILAPAIHKDRTRLPNSSIGSSGPHPASTWIVSYAPPAKPSGTVSSPRRSELPAQILPLPRPGRWCL